MFGTTLFSEALASVSCLNGLRNQSTSITGVSNADPRFLRALELFARIQL